MYDSGIKTPWIVKWPKGIEAGSQSSSLVSSLDIANTFLALAGINPLEDSPGVDFSPVFTEPDKGIRDYIYGQAHWHDHENFVRSVRSEERRVGKECRARWARSRGIKTRERGRRKARND